MDEEIGVAVIDRFTFAALEFVTETLLADEPDVTLDQFAGSWDVQFLHSKPVLDTHRLKRAPEEIRLAEFFTNRQAAVELPNLPGFDLVNTGKGELTRPPWAANNARLVIDKSANMAPSPLPMRHIKLYNH